MNRIKLAVLNLLIDILAKVNSWSNSKLLTLNFRYGCIQDDMSVYPLVDEDDDYDAFVSWCEQRIDIMADI